MRKLPPPRVAAERTFDTFVVRRQNRQAFRYFKWLSARAPSGGLVLLSGPSGSGKTHLVRSALTHWQRTRPSLRFLSLSAPEALQHLLTLSLGADAKVWQNPSALPCDVLVIEHLESVLTQERGMHLLLSFLAHAAKRGTRVLVTLSSDSEHRAAEISETVRRVVPLSRLLAVGHIGGRR